MSSHVVGRRLLRTVPLVGLVLASVGCPDEAAQITEQPSAPSQEFPITGSFVSPSGSFALNSFKFADFDSTSTDAFGRTRTFLTDSATFFTCGGPCPAWDFPIRNGSQDTRLPALVDPDAVGLVAITPDSIFGIPLIVFTLAGLNPNTDYVWALERMSLTVNEGLDAANVLMDNVNLGPLQTSPDTPDELARLGGTPGAGLGDNYYELGGFTSDGAGASGFLNFGFAGTGNSDIIETNRLQGFNLPQYNYLVLYEGSPADGIQVMRAQVGVDLDVSGSPINNALAPFPVDSMTLNELTVAPGGAGTPDSLTFTINANSLELLDTLGNAQRYEAWLVDAGSGTAIPAVGRYLQIAGTDTLQDLSGVNTWAGGEGSLHRLILSDAGFGGGPADSLAFYSHVVLTIDESPGDMTMSAVQPLWAWYDNRGDPGDLFDDVFNPQGTAAGFGRLNLANPAASVPFGGQGSGEGSVREGILNASLQALSRPPLGYVYAAWLLGPDTVQLPDITGPLPEAQSLVDADENTIPGLVTENGILDANFRLDSNAAMIDLSLYGTFRVTLEPKVGASKMSATRTLTGTPP